MIDQIKIYDCENMPAVKKIEHSSFIDNRGQLFTHYTEENEKLILRGKIFNHNKIAISNKNVLRGIHGDFKSYKLISCLYGEIYQVVVDCRSDEKTFGEWFGIVLNEEKNLSLLLPPGFGNGYLTLSTKSVYNYKLSYLGSYIDADRQFTFAWNDPNFKIDWPVENPILSERDIKP